MEGVAVQVSSGVVGLGKGDGLADGDGLGESDGDGDGIAGDSLASDGDDTGDTWPVAPGAPHALTIETTPIAMPIPQRLTEHPTEGAALSFRALSSAR
jgi:hypothetical protein